MKSLLVRLSFLPFALAIFWGAKVMWDKVNTPAPVPAAQIVSSFDGPTVQLALVLDISGSMDGLIEQAQARFWKLVNELARTSVKGQTPRLEIALYIYGGDHLSPDLGYVRQLTPFTTDLDVLSEQLFSLSTNGGEEYCGAALQATLRELAWQDNPETLRLLFIAGNESFRQGNVDFEAVCQDAAQRGIVVNTIFCGPFAQGEVLDWAKGAQLGGGQYLSIDHNLGLEDAPTPFDDQFQPLNAALNNTYLHYGADGLKKVELMFSNDAANSNKSLSAACDRTSAKANGAYSNSLSWDLVEASSDAAFEWSKLDKNTLPTDCRNLSTEALKKLVEEKRADRQKIQAEINKITQLRSEYLSQLESKGENRLDDALVQCLHKQASAKGYVFE